jgi:hypothetical protein
MQVIPCQARLRQVRTGKGRLGRLCRISRD